MNRLFRGAASWLALLAMLWSGVAGALCGVVGPGAATSVHRQVCRCTVCAGRVCCCGRGDALALRPLCDSAAPHAVVATVRVALCAPLPPLASAPPVTPPAPVAAERPVRAGACPPLPPAPPPECLS